MRQLIFLIYDGIENSVFAGQVLEPLKKRLSLEEDLGVSIVSFENRHFDPSKICSFSNDRLRVFVLKKIPFMGRISLLYALRKFISFYRKEFGSCIFQIIARGPLAGWIARRAGLDVPLIIQARGLAAEEFRFANEQAVSNPWKSLLKKMFRKFIYNSYKKIELEAYGKGVKIVAVSPALKDYLITNFASDPLNISVSIEDVPEKISVEQVEKWRNEVREELKIPNDAYVYCYAGSALSWQCVDEMIDYFISQYKFDNKSFFLVFSKDKMLFETKLVAKLAATKLSTTRPQKFSNECFLVVSVDHCNIYRYLSAADAGLLFRKPDPVNFVSRPTKFLEYQAVGLKIIHNETIRILKEF